MRSKMVKARKYVVKNRFSGIAKREDFEIVEYELPHLQEGEILIKSEWISVDPYMRVFNRKYSKPYDQFGFQVGSVLESRDAKYPAGTRVVTHMGWCDHGIVNPSKFTDILDVIYELPDMQGLSDSIGLGAIGIVGVTAYFGLLEICRPKPGETLVVTVAAGAVGSIVGQIGKIKGCRVIGFTGTEQKVNWLEKELGFDKAYNYKTTDIEQALKEAAPNGIDCYFDNVGGEISSIIINQMNDLGRISVCGSISVYNSETKDFPKVTSIQKAMVFKQLSMEGFLVYRWINDWPVALENLAKWIKSGQIKVKEHVVEGFDNIFDAFTGMMSGDNMGKTVVKV